MSNGLRLLECQNCHKTFKSMEKHRTANGRLYPMERRNCCFIIGKLLAEGYYTMINHNEHHRGWSHHYELVRTSQPVTTELIMRVFGQ